MSLIQVSGLDLNFVTIIRSMVFPVLSLPRYSIIQRRVALCRMLASRCAFRLRYIDRIVIAHARLMSYKLQ
jgi:hypothetical protein